MNRKHQWLKMFATPRSLVFAAVAALAVGADQLAKQWIRDTYALGEGVVLYPGDVVLPRLGLEHVMNPGGPLSLLAWVPGMQLVFAITVAVVSLVCLDMVRRSEGVRRLRVLPLGLLAGGAIGNGLDRMLFGAVTDFVLISFDQPWLAPILQRTIRTTDGPVFNLADVFLGVGLVAVFLEYLAFLAWTVMLHPGESEPEVDYDLPQEEP